MKRLGLIGGISWVSTIDYYKYINEGINEQLGGLEFAECLVYSLNFNDIQRNGWDDLENTYRLICNAGERLKSAGAEGLVLCANTAHVVADRVQQTVQLPLIHIAVETAADIKRHGLTRVALLGTKFTMEMDFYRETLRQCGVDSFVPAQQDIRDFIQQTLKEELGKGIIKAETRAAYLSIIRQLIEEGAEGIILGCTEIPLIIGPADVPVPLFDTTRIHARAAVNFALSN